MDASERLARFELVLAQAKAEQQQIGAALTELKAAGQIKSYRFKELLAARQMNETLLACFRRQGLE